MLFVSVYKVLYIKVVLVYTMRKLVRNIASTACGACAANSVNICPEGNPGANGWFL